MHSNWRRDTVVIDRKEIKEAFESKINFLLFWLDIAIAVQDEYLEEVICDMLNDEYDKEDKQQ